MSDAQNTMNHARETVRQWDTTDPLAMNVESWFMHFGSELSCRLGDLSLFREHAPHWDVTICQDVPIGAKEVSTECGKTLRFTREALCQASDFWGGEKIRAYYNADEEIYMCEELDQ